MKCNHYSEKFPSSDSEEQTVRESWSQERPFISQSKGDPHHLWLYKFVHTDNRQTKRSLKVETSNTLSNMYNRYLPNKQKSLQTLSESSPNTDEHVLQKRREGHCSNTATSEKIQRPSHDYLQNKSMSITHPPYSNRAVLQPFTIATTLTVCIILTIATEHKHFTMVS